jgi:hypothetical protein
MDNKAVTYGGNINVYVEYNFRSPGSVWWQVDVLILWETVGRCYNFDTCIEQCHKSGALEQTVEGLVPTIHLWNRFHSELAAVSRDSSKAQSSFHCWI